MSCFEMHEGDRQMYSAAIEFFCPNLLFVFWFLVFCWFFFGFFDWNFTH